jgi:hypothetical protein
MITYCHLQKELTNLEKFCTKVRHDDAMIDLGQIKKYTVLYTCDKKKNPGQYTTVIKNVQCKL